jgi:hypothetical protein
VNLQDFVGDPKVFDAACKTTHRLLPPPARWALREKGVRRILEKARDLYVSTHERADSDGAGGTA